MKRSEMVDNMVGLWQLMDSKTKESGRAMPIEIRMSMMISSMRRWGMTPPVYETKEVDSVKCYKREWEPEDE